MVSLTKPSEDNPVCIKCGMYEHYRNPFMRPSGSATPEILIVGESPGEEESKAGKPFVGRSGQLLREVLTELDVDVNNQVQFTNVVRCRPPENKITPQAIKACTPFVIEEVLNTTAKIVLLMGNTPLHAILGESGITNWNGVMVNKVFGEKEMTFLPLYHPAYILRDITRMDEWLGAMTKVVDGNETKVTKFDRRIIKTLDEIKEMERYLTTFEEISFDTETSRLDAFSNDSFIISASFAAGVRSFSYPIQHPDHWWADDDFAEVCDITKRILESHSGHVICHNAKFDLMHIYAYLGAWFDIGGDTMLQSHLIDSRPGIHGLKHLAGIYLGMYEYERDLMEYRKAHRDADVAKGGSYANVPMDILLPYGAMDAEATLMLHPILFDKLSAEQKVFYKDVVIPASTALARVQCNGFKVDKYVADRYMRIYSFSANDALEDINNDKKVKKLVAARQAKLNEAWVVKSRGKQHIYSFNPGSSLQLLDLYDNYCHIPIRTTKEKRPTTAGAAYRDIEDKYPILFKIRRYKLFTKMLSTYLRPLAQGVATSSDDKVHTTFNQHGTVTGRLSSSQPMNLQNIPTPEKEPGTLLETLPIKNCFTHVDWWDVLYGNDVDAADIIGDDFDTGALVGGDFSGMELRVFASLAKCQTMIDIHNSGQDFHKCVAALSKHMITKDDLRNAADLDLSPVLNKISKAMRYVYKWTSWTLLYGGDEYTLHRLYGVPLADAKETLEIYYDVFPEVLDFKEYTAESARENGYIESPFGRRIWLPRINDRDTKMRNADERAAVNAPVQSGASDTLTIALTILDIEMRKQGYYSKIVNTVHDSIVGDCPRFEIVKFGLLCKDVMENVATYAKTYMPNVPFDWLICPLKADIEVGTHYGNKMDFEDWRKRYDISSLAHP